LIMEKGRTKMLLAKKRIKNYYPALSWLVLFFGFVLVVLHRFVTAGLQDIFTETFAISSAGFALLSSSYFYLYPLMQVPAGMAIDLFGPRKITTFSFLIMTIGTIFFAAATTFGQLFWGRMMISFGAAFIWGSLLKVQGIHFSGRIFAFLAGFGAVAASFGVILAGSPFMAGATRLGWREMIYLLAICSFLLLLGNLIFTRDPVNRVGSNRPTPNQFKPSNRKNKTDLAGTVTVLKQKSGWLLFLCHFGIYGPYAAFIGIWSYPFLVGEAGYTVSQASFFITFLGISYMLGGPLLGHLSDRMGERRRPVLLISCVFLAMFTAAFLFLPYLNGKAGILLYPVLFVIGFFTPSLILTMVLSRELQNPKYSGVAVGIANSGGFVGAAIAQLVVGLILEKGWQGQYVNGIMSYPWPVYQQVILFSTLLITLAFLSAYLVEEKKA